jgi:hypothetical protein
VTRSGLEVERITPHASGFVLEILARTACRQRSQARRDGLRQVPSVIA